MPDIACTAFGNHQEGNRMHARFPVAVHIFLLRENHVLLLRRLIPVMRMEITASSLAIWRVESV
jgi:hypothetical protein